MIRISPARRIRWIGCARCTCSPRTSDLVRWLCNEAGGFYVSNPVPEIRKSLDETIFNETRSMVRDFSELLEAVTESVEGDSNIDPNEADVIREKWEDLKGLRRAVCHQLREGTLPSHGEAAGEG